MEKLDNIRIGNIFKNECPINIKKIKRSNPTKIVIKKNIKSGKSHRSVTLRIYKNPYVKEERKKCAYLKLELYNFKNNHWLRITNSLRKWYFGINSTQDFNWENFCDCLKLLSKMLCIELVELLQFKIYKMEFGVTYKLPSEFKYILQKLSAHRDLKKYGQFDNCSTVYFNGENMGIICYDVLQKMFDNQEISKHVYNKISEKYFFFRLELKIFKRSGVNFANENISTLEDLINNSADVLQYWIKQMLSIEVNEDISIEEIIKIKNLTPKDFIEFTSSKYVELISMQKMNAYVDLAIDNNPKKKYTIKNALKKNQEKWRVKNKTSNKEFLEELIFSVQK